MTINQFLLLLKSTQPLQKEAFLQQLSISYFYMHLKQASDREIPNNGKGLAMQLIFNNFN